jgi:hypothetical protein
MAIFNVALLVEEEPVLVNLFSEIHVVADAAARERVTLSNSCSLYNLGVDPIENTIFNNFI